MPKPTTHDKPTAPAWVRVAIWAALVLAVTLAALPNQRHATAARAEARRAAGASASGSQVVAPQATSPAGGLRAAADPPAPTSTGSGGLGLDQLQSCPGVLVKVPADQPCPTVSKIGYLPAWRWTDVDLSAREGGFFGFLKSISTGLVSIFFLAANLLWQLLLGLLRFGLTVSFLEPAARAINNGAATLVQSMAVLLVLGWVFVLAMAVRQWLRGRLHEGIRIALTFTLAMGAVFAIGVQARSPQAQSDPFNAKGTLPWLAATVDAKLDLVTGELGSGFGLVEDPNDPVKGSDSGGAGVQGAEPTCSAYVAALYQQYQASQAAAGNAADHGAVAAASRLWESGFMRAWQAAQFGSSSAQPDLPGRAGCHLLEAKAGLRAADQQEIIAVAYPSLAGRVNDAVLIQDDEDERRKTIIGWAACTYVGGDWALTPAFEGVKDLEAADCKTLFEDGEIGDGKSNAFSFKNTKRFSTDSAELREAQAPARSLVSAYNGDNFSGRVLQGMIALVTAAIFFFVLGSVALGMVATQFMLVLLLVLLPLTLAMLGLRVGSGPKLLRLTGTTMASQFLFGLLLTFLTESIGLGQALINGVSGAGGASLFEQILLALMPLLSLVVVKKLLSYVGMADITRPTGGLQFAYAASLKATRDPALMRAGDAGRDGLGVLGRGLRGAGEKFSRAETEGKKLNRFQKLTKRMAQFDSKTWSRHVGGWAAAGALGAGKGATSYGRWVGANAAAVAGRYAPGAVAAAGRGAALAKALPGELAETMTARGWAPAKLGSLVKTIGTAGAGAGAAGILGGGPGAVALGGAALPFALPLAALGVGASLARRGLVREDLPPVSQDAFVDDAKMCGAQQSQRRKQLAAQLAGLSREEQRAVLEADAERFIALQQQVRFGRTFDALATPLAVADMKAAYAAATGRRPDQVLGSAAGVLCPAPITHTRRRIKGEVVWVPSFPEGTTPEHLRSMILHLPDEVTARRPDETEDEHAVRLRAVQRARGGFDETTGAELDMLAARAGLDIDANKADRARVEQFIADPSSDPELCRLLYVSKRPSDEKVQVAAALAAARRHRAEFEDRTAKHADELLCALAETRTELPAAHASVDANLNEMKMLVETMRAVQGRVAAAGPGGEAARSAYTDQLRELRSRLEGLGRSVVGTMNDIRDDQGFLLVDLEARTARDVGELSELAEDARRKVLAAAREAEENFERCAARLYSDAPADAARLLVESLAIEAHALALRSQEALAQAEAQQAEDARKLGELAVTQARYAQPRKVVRARDLVGGRAPFD